MNLSTVFLITLDLIVASIVGVGTLGTGVGIGVIRFPMDYILCGLFLSADTMLYAVFADTGTLALLGAIVFTETPVYFGLNHTAGDFLNGVMQLSLTSYLRSFLNHKFVTKVSQALDGFVSYLMLIVSKWLLQTQCNWELNLLVFGFKIRPTVEAYNSEMHV